MSEPRQNGPQIRALRQARGIKTKDFARLVGYDSKSLSHIEGNRACASVEGLHRIAKALGVEYEVLLRAATRRTGQVA